MPRSGQARTCGARRTVDQQRPAGGHGDVNGQHDPLVRGEYIHIPVPRRAGHQVAAPPRRVRCEVRHRSRLLLQNAPGHPVFECPCLFQSGVALGFQVLNLKGWGRGKRGHRLPASGPASRREDLWLPAAAGRSGQHPAPAAGSQRQPGCRWWTGYSGEPGAKLGGPALMASVRLAGRSSSVVSSIALPEVTATSSAAGRSGWHTGHRVRLALSAILTTATGRVPLASDSSIRLRAGRWPDRDAGVRPRDIVDVAGVPGRHLAELLGGDDLEQLQRGIEEPCQRVHRPGLRLWSVRGGRMASAATSFPR